MNPGSNKMQTASDISSWQKVVAKYQRPDHRRSLWQTANSLIPFFALWYLMYLSLGISYWITLGLSFPASGFLIRIFIISHDCGHGAFFKSRKANSILGSITSILTFIPYHRWKHEHAVHHATAGDLDGRGVGDIWTLTVKEYLELSFWRRIGYRIYRNPFVMFGVGAMFTFLIHYRFPTRNCGKRERTSNHRTNLALFTIVSILGITIGPEALLLVQLPILMISSAAGAWLFYVQHQFEGVYWDRNENWDYITEAMEGSSFYRLPKILQWFTGNIGFHHIHHLSPRIPNYFLEKCHKENLIFQKVKHITPLSSLRSLTFRLWDENRRKLVGFSYLKVLRAQNAMAVQ